MAMYGLATTPLIRRLDGLCMQVWYADDSAAAGRLAQLREWWDKLASEGPSFGYYANPSKTWLVTKDGYLEEASAIFADCGVNITPNGRLYLGAVIGLQEFTAEYVRSKVSDWSCPSWRDRKVTATCCLFSTNTRVTDRVGRPISAASFPTLQTNFLPWMLLRSDLLPGRPPPSDLQFALLALPT